MFKALLEASWWLNLNVSNKCGLLVKLNIAFKNNLRFPEDKFRRLKRLCEWSEVDILQILEV